MPTNKLYQDISYDNLKAYWQTLANQPEGICHQNEKGLMILTGAKQALLNPGFLEAGATLSALKKCNHPHSFWWDNQRNANLKMAKDSSEILLENVPMMVRQLGDKLPVVLPEGLEIKLVENNKDLSKWMDMVVKCFEMDELSAKAYQTGLEMNADKFVHFAVYDKDKIVGTGTLFLHEKSAGLYNLSVSPDYRKQGIGKAIHHARFNHAQSLGYEYVTLQATPMATHLDETLGFETCSEMTIYKL